MPDRLFRQPLSPGFPHLVHPTKQLARCNVRCLDPLVDDILHPCRHRGSCGCGLPFPSDRQWPSGLHAVGCGLNSAQLPHAAVGHRQVRQPEVLDPSLAGCQQLGRSLEGHNQRPHKPSVGRLLNEDLLFPERDFAIRDEFDSGVRSC